MKFAIVVLMMFVMLGCDQQPTQRKRRKPNAKQALRNKEDKLPAIAYTSVYPKDTTPPKNTKYPCDFSSLPPDMKGIPAYHHSFLDKMCAIVVKGIHARLEAEMALYISRHKRQNDEVAAKKYEEITSELATQLSNLQVPESWKEIPPMISEAITLQGEIYAHALRGGDLIKAKHQASSLLLRKVWTNLYQRFRGMDAKVRKSMFHHFCALDISGSTQPFEKK